MWGSAVETEHLLHKTKLLKRPNLFNCAPFLSYKLAQRGRFSPVLPLFGMGTPGPRAFDFAALRGDHHSSPSIRIEEAAASKRHSGSAQTSTSAGSSSSSPLTKPSRALADLAACYVGSSDEEEEGRPQRAVIPAPPRSSSVSAASVSARPSG